MKQFLWFWFFSVSFVFTGILAISLGLSYILFSTAPHNPYTPVFAIAFGFIFGFTGLASLTFLFYDGLVNKLNFFEEEEGELVKKVVREAPFFFFSLIFFFIMGLYMGVYMMIINFIRNAF
ncbi:MAG: hypothetical protein HQM10_18570 [Candidatus Riflebacteria bacterium]|nr:hypothetical protein [Candidatus Riflebacteria bacterium]